MTDTPHTGTNNDQKSTNAPGQQQQNQAPAKPSEQKPNEQQK